MFENGGFQLRKWHSNFSVLETNDLEENFHGVTINERNQSYSKILGLLWDKNDDTLIVDCRPNRRINIITKRGISGSLAKVFNPLGVISLIALTAKLKPI